jgi:hypothetical protein
MVKRSSDWLLAFVGEVNAWTRNHKEGALEPQANNVVSLTNACEFNNNRLRTGTCALGARGRHATRGMPAII